VFASLLKVTLNILNILGPSISWEAKADDNASMRIPIYIRKARGTTMRAKQNGALYKFDDIVRSACARARPCTRTRRRGFRRLHNCRSRLSHFRLSSSLRSDQQIIRHFHLVRNPFFFLLSLSLFFFCFFFFFPPEAAEDDPRLSHVCTSELWLGDRYLN